ncbi:hypothetical protein Nepgr_006687 [Nepenthes gracilis]|uniref:Uncharacterized protein n=1 Tax=Nepenthes gracilis TaxID=150966 RepID=A0AAD3S6B8_NEPGR|nr:hypothetical protein Nepgr_006687 [Nepenthes gracilis]
MYKATGRVLPLHPSFPGPATKNPSSPKEIVKENHAATSTSNSFEILLVEDVLSNLGNSVTQVELPPKVVVMDRLESHDACNSSLALASPGPPHHNTSDEVLVTNRDSITSQPPQICRADTVGRSVLEEIATCANADTSLGLPSGIPNCYEEMAIKSTSLGTLSPSSILQSNDPDGGPPSRSTRARKAKRSTEVGSASGKSIPVPGNARKVQA